MNPNRAVIVNGQPRSLTHTELVTIGLSCMNVSTQSGVRGGKTMNDHCFIVAETGTLKCSHCGQEYTPTYPVPINMLGAMIEAFQKSHAECEPKKKELHPVRDGAWEWRD